MYIDPMYITHVVTGAGGCREFYDYYDNVFYGAWSVVRSSTYGYGRLTVHNETHLSWVQLLDEGRGGTDPLWIIKKGKGEKVEEPEVVDETEESEQIVDRQSTPLIAEM